MSTTSTALTTAEELMELPHGEGFRYELINGELEITMSPGLPRGRITMRLAGPLSEFIWAHDLGETERYCAGAPDLVVEVLSPSDRPSKVNKKTLLWLTYGAKQVWIANPRGRTVRIHRSPSDATTFSASDYLEAPDLLPGFRLSLDRIFSTSTQEK